MKKICAIVGATGFVGRSLVEQLKGDHDIRALSRREIPPDGNIRYVKCDLFSLKQLESALQGVDVAIYLVHSMQPKRGLLQGSFQDIDLFLADNFARAVSTCRVKKVIYLGGIIPDGPISKHLLSRFEVEQTLQSSPAKFYGLRAGVIVGSGGSSFEMMKRLVMRLPIMICPRWTQNLSTPIVITDVVAVIRSLIDREEVTPGVYDIGGPETLSYVDLMKKTANILELKRTFLMTRYLTLSLSKLWVKIFGSTPYSLVSPLVDSLKYSIAVPELKLQKILNLVPMSISKGISAATSQNNPGIEPSHPTKIDDPLVTSIQRLPLPPNLDAQSVALEYTKWLHRFFWPFLRVTFRENVLSFDFVPLKIFNCSTKLLEMQYSVERSSRNRILYYITGGILDHDSKKSNGRLEFREVLDRKFILSAVLQFRPKIRWRVYRITQALAHPWIMRFFGGHLSRLK